MKNFEFKLTITNNTLVEAIGQNGIIDIMEECLININGRTVVLDGINQGLVMIGKEQNPAYFCDPLSESDYVGILQYITDNPDHVYSTIATDGEGYNQDFDYLEVSLDVVDSKPKVISEWDLNIAGKCMLQTTSVARVSQYLKGIVNNFPIFDSQYPITVEAIIDAKNRGVKLDYLLQAAREQLYLRGEEVQNIAKMSVNVVKCRDEIFIPKGSRALFKDFKIRTDGTDTYLVHDGEPISYNGEVDIVTYNGQFKHIIAEEIINDRIVRNHRRYSFTWNITQPTVIKRCHKYPDLLYTGIIKESAAAPNKTTEQSMIKETLTVSQSTLFETGDLSELKRQGKYLMSVSGDKYVAVEPNLPWIGSVDTNMFNEELYTVNGIAVYVTNQSGMHVSPAGSNMVFLVDNNIAMRVPRMAGMTTPEITGYNKAKLYSVSETNRVFLNSYDNGGYFDDNTIVTNGFIFDTNFTTSPARSLDPTNRILIGKSNQFELYELGNSACKLGYCESNGYPSIVFEYDETVYLFVNKNKPVETNNVITVKLNYGERERGWTQQFINAGIDTNRLYHVYNLVPEDGTDVRILGSHYEFEAIDRHGDRILSGLLKRTQLNFIPL